VSGEPFGAWSSHPFHAGVRGGRIYGRGVVDMKGGVAAMVFAAEVLARRGVALGGDLLINTVTEEESTGAGTIAAIAHGLGADAAIVTEPTSLDIGIGCRGSMLPTVHIPGRTGHAAATQPPWQEGGAVSAAEKTAPIVDALVRLRQLWHDRPDQQHEFMPPSKIVVTKVQSGNWDVSYAESAEIQCHVSYQPIIDQAWGESFQTEGGGRRTTRGGA
jgi:acetylornithine deacetylase